MKNSSFTYVLLLMACALIIQTSRVKITSCLLCSGESPCNGTAMSCGKTLEPGTPDDAETSPADGGAEAPPAKKLVKKRDDGDADAGDDSVVLADDAVGDPTVGEPHWKCLTITGKHNETMETQMWKGCSESCHKKVGLFAVEQNCEQCDDADNCNSSGRINQMGWLLVMTSLICVGWQ